MFQVRTSPIVNLLFAEDAPCTADDAEFPVFSCYAKDDHYTAVDTLDPS